MSSSIRLKKSSVTGNVPSALEYGELAINTLDGKLYYKNSSDTLIHSLDEIETIAAVTSQTLIKGEVVYVSGAVSGKVQVSKFSALSTFGVDESKLVGLAANGTTGTANETVNVVSFGKLYDVVYDSVKQTGEVNTWAVGTDLYVSATTTGKLTATIPTAPNLRIVIATVVSVSGGNRTLLVRFQPELHLNEVHDVFAPTPSDGQVLKWTAANNRWEAGTVSGGSGNSFTNIAVSGQSTIVADSATDTLTLSAGNAILLITDPATDTLTVTVDSTSLPFLPNSGGFLDGELQIWNSGGSIFSVYKNETTGSVSFLVNGNDVYSEEVNFNGNGQGGAYNFVWNSTAGIGLEVNGSTGDVTTEGTFYSTGNVINSTSGPASSLEQTFGFTTAATTANQVIASISASSYRTVKFLIQVTQGTNYETTEILAIHNGTTATHTEYGTVVIGTNPASFNVDVSGGNIRLLTTPTSASSTDFKIKATSITV